MNGTYDIPYTSVGAAALKGSLACAIGRIKLFTTSTLNLYDLAHPAAPILLSSTPFRNVSSGLVLSGSLALIPVQGHTMCLRIFDIANPTSPTIKGSYYDPACGPGSDYPHNHYLAAAGAWAYLAADERTDLSILDLSDPAAPVLKLKFPLLGPVQSLALCGNELLAGAPGRLEVIDVSRPAAPVRKGVYYPDSRYKVKLWSNAGPVAHLGQDGAFHTLDLRNPASPSLLGQIGLPRYCLRCGRHPRRGLLL